MNGVDATIAVSAKYNKDGLPQGDVHYTAHIPGGDLTLKSTSLQSVSIVGNTAVILGKATIGNTGNYSSRPPSPKQRPAIPSACR